MFTQITGDAECARQQSSGQSWRRIFTNLCAEEMSADIAKQASLEARATSTSAAASPGPGYCSWLSDLMQLFTCTRCVPSWRGRTSPLGFLIAPIAATNTGRPGKSCFKEPMVAGNILPCFSSSLNFFSNSAAISSADL